MELRILCRIAAALTIVFLLAGCGGRPMTIEHWDPVTGHTRWEIGRPSDRPPGSNQYSNCGTIEHDGNTYNIMCDLEGRPRYAVPQNRPGRWIPIDSMSGDGDPSGPVGEDGPVSDSVFQEVEDLNVALNVEDEQLPTLRLKSSNVPVLLPEHYEGTTAEVLTYFGVDLTDPAAALNFFADFDAKQGEATFIAPLPSGVVLNLPTLEGFNNLDFELEVVEFYDDGNPAVAVLGLRGPVEEVAAYLQSAGFTQIHFDDQSFAVLRGPVRLGEMVGSH